MDRATQRLIVWAVFLLGTLPLVCAVWLAFAGKAVPEWLGMMASGAVPGLCGIMNNSVGKHKEGEDEENGN